MPLQFIRRYLLKLKLNKQGYRDGYARRKQDPVLSSPVFGLDMQEAYRIAYRRGQEKKQEEELRGFEENEEQ